MGRLLEGKWITNDLGPDEKGRYVRRATQFRNEIPSDKFPVEKGRYRLILSHACGWSHRCLLVRALKGLEDVIPVTFCDPFMGQEKGWTLGLPDGIDQAALLPAGNNGNDSAKRITALYEVYCMADSEYTGRASVPVLWDSQSGTIVNNESSDIVRFLCQEFDEFAVHKNVELHPGQVSVEEMIKANYDTVNNAVYRCGFAGSQEAYSEAAVALFQRLDEIEEILSTKRYLCSKESPTLADLCLFPTVYRFDSVYYTHFKCNKKHIYEYPNIWGWLLEIYQMAGVKETCDMGKIKEHYFTSHESIHPRRYIPIGPDIDFDQPHGRDKLF
mmetsp:Transcript_3863/g.7911  ORF Transcript_3863/g.7911 Transcript_3863/m.7911 type:complete len:329 (+) Transcript_3863:53-1039(+)|eukprot:CAMPEP_0168842316 /NCGR_PEP_ID=MMETSP0727-20121128/7630_1 /TAXON_ID=265536 /ORGANISM="Amphiprora sp., Strain CCMP467" /LENGTH=328 /DNA_ID=CAMNT_0008895867 /DNA_START=21 /DNA_END=1007 /DNA_ORIENTATION=+